MTFVSNSFFFLLHLWKKFTNYLKEERVEEFLTRTQNWDSVDTLVLRVSGPGVCVLRRICLA